jgi:hypothetical protein
VLEIRDTQTTVDTRWTFFQAPLEVEDALGFKFPIPTEYDYDLIETIIRHRFKSGARSMEVKVGNYELCNTRKRSDIITKTSRLLPGTALTMIIVVSAPIV